MADERRQPSRRGRWLPTAASAALCALLVAVCAVTAQPDAGTRHGALVSDVIGRVAAADGSAASAASDGAGAIATQPPAEQAETGPVVEYRDVDDPQAFGGAAFESGAVLVALSDGSTFQDVADALTAEHGFDGFTVLNTAGSYVKVGLPDALSVADALDVLADVDALSSVQPNFEYFLADADAASSLTGATSAASFSAASAPLAAVALKAAEADQLAAQSAANDPFSSSQWALESIHAYEAWDLAQGSHYVTVAVADNLFNLSHEDLKSNVVAPYNAVVQQADYDMQGATYHGRSPIGHGTHVAGIVAAETDNNLGIAGASHNAYVMPIRIEDDLGTISTEYLINAYDYILANADEYNVRVINLSVGAGRKNLSWDSLDRALFSKIDEAYDAGILTVTAACNSGNGYTAPFFCFPGDYDKCVNVININRQLVRSASSNYNRFSQRTKDISAPGTDILSATMSNTANPLANDYASMSGTSMAAPYVSSVLAVMFVADDRLTPAAAASRLYSTATDLNTAENINKSAFDVQTGWGEVNAYEAVKATTVALEGNPVIAVGQTTRLVFSPERPDTWSWSTADPSVAAVEGDESGVTVTGLGAGEAVVTAANGRGARAVQTVSVYDPAIKGSPYAAVGASVNYSVAPLPAGVWNWTSSNPSVVEVRSVSSAGCTVSCKHSGVATLTATLRGNANITSSLKISVGASIAGAELLNLQEYAYEGEPVEQPDMQVALGGRILEEGVDYTVAYAYNDQPGVAMVTVVGRGAFVGTKTKAFHIGVGSIADADVEGVVARGYTGFALTQPDLKVTYDGELLAARDDYTVTYQNNVDAGMATVTITGRGAYVGSKTVAFSVIPASIDGAVLTVSGSPKTYTGSPITAVTSVRLNGKVLSSPDDCQIAYYDNVNVGTALVVATGVGNYRGSVVGAFEIAPASFDNATVSLASPTYIYSGSGPAQPEPDVRLGGARLVEGIDYALSWVAGDEEGLCAVVVEGLGNYVGSASAEYRLVKASLADAEVYVSDQYYTGRSVRPKPVVLFGDKVLAQGVDYTVAYADNVELGTATVKLTGRGDFSGTWEGTFDIVPRPFYFTGATSMAAGSQSAWRLWNCHLQVVSGDDVVAVSDGAKVRALAPGTAEVAIIDECGATIAIKPITVNL